MAARRSEHRGDPMKLSIGCNCTFVLSLRVHSLFTTRWDQAKGSPSLWDTVRIRRYTDYISGRIYSCGPDRNGPWCRVDKAIRGANLISCCKPWPLRPRLQMSTQPSQRSRQPLLYRCSTAAVRSISTTGSHPLILLFSLHISARILRVWQ